MTYATYHVFHPQVCDVSRCEFRSTLSLLDTSKSMLASDLTPNRLQRARLAALDLMELAQQDRLGLVAFSGSAFLQCPLTLDNQAFRQSVDILGPNVIPQGGTSISEAIGSALTAFDPENNKPMPLSCFKRLALL